MMEPSEYKERNAMEDNFSDLKVSDKSEDDDVGGLSRWKLVMMMVILWWKLSFWWKLFSEESYLVMKVT